MSNLKASDFKIDERVIYHFDGKKYKGKILDHFGDGLFIKLEKSINYPNQNPGANPMGYNTDHYINEFELYDNEINPWGEISFLQKLKINQ